MIDDDKITKVKYPSKPGKDGSEQFRYAFRAVDDDGTNLTKFASKADWDAHPGKEE